MSVVGINEIFASNLSVFATGAPRDFANKAAFTGAGYNLTWMDEDGVDLVSQPTWDMVRSDTNGDHYFQAEVVLGAYAIRMTVPGTDYASLTIWTGRGTTYGIDDIGGMIATTGAVAVTPTLTQSTASMFDGDSIDVSVSVSETALDSIGAASLAACDTKRAYIKLDSVDSDDAPTVGYADLTVTVTSDVEGTRTLRITKDAFPAVLGVPDATKSLACTLMVELGEGSKLIIAASVSLTILWVSRNGALT